MDFRFLIVDSRIEFESETRTRQINRRFTQTNAEEDLFTKESQRIAFFVCRETTTKKTRALFKAKTFAQSSSPDWAKILPFAYSASLR